MRESSTIQAFLEEGRVKGLAEEARRIILLQGPMRFGAANEEVKTRLDEIHDLEQLGPRREDGKRRKGNRCQKEIDVGASLLGRKSMSVHHYCGSRSSPVVSASSVSPAVVAVHHAKR